MKREEHYLAAELYERARRDPVLLAFLQQGELDGIWYWDLEQPEHEWLSPSLWRSLGHDPVGKKHLASEWDPFIFPEDREKAFACFERHKEDPEHPYDVLLRYYHRDGSTVWVRCRGVLFRNEQGTPIRMLGVHTNITASQEAERALREKQRLLDAYARSNQELRQFAHTVSHDLQEPIRMVHSFCRLLRERHGSSLDEESAQWLHFVIDGAERMQELLRGLLLYNKFESQYASFEALDTDAVLRSLVFTLSEPGTTGQLHLQEEPFPIVKADRHQFEQVCRQLIDNGLKFNSSALPEVWISCRALEGAWEFSIRDNGDGIPEKHHQRIFGLFKRLVSHEECPGTGLGLALCHKFIEHHDGKIWLDSDDEGTIFYFTLPDAGDAEVGAPL